MGESDRSHVTSEDIAVKMDETKVVKEVSQPTSNKPSISEDWMIDDVGTIESSDEESDRKDVTSENIPVKMDETKVEKEVSQPTSNKPSISEDWMIDDVRTIVSSYDEEILTNTDFEFKDGRSLGTIESSDEEVMEERRKEVK